MGPELRTLDDYAGEVGRLERTPPDAEAAAALERAIASAPWGTPQEREGAQVLIMRLALLRAGGPRDGDARADPREAPAS